MKFLIKFVVVLAVLAAVVHFGAGYAVKSAVEAQASEIVKTDVRIDWAGINWLDGRLTMKGIRVANPEGYNNPTAIELEKFDVAVAPMSLMSDLIVVKEIYVGGMVFTVENKGLTESNVQKILDNIKHEADSEEYARRARMAQPKKMADGSDVELPEEPKKVKLDKMEIAKGKVQIMIDVPGQDMEVASLNMPGIKARNVGGEDGVTVVYLAETILEPLLEEAAQEGLKLVARNSKIGKAVEDIKDSVTEGIKGFFGG